MHVLRSASKVRRWIYWVVAGIFVLGFLVVVFFGGKDVYGFYRAKRDFVVYKNEVVLSLDSVTEDVDELIGVVNGSEGTEEDVEKIDKEAEELGGKVVIVRGSFEDFDVSADTERLTELAEEYLERCEDVAVSASSLVEEVEGGGDIDRALGSFGKTVDEAEAVKDRIDREIEERLELF